MGYIEKRGKSSWRITATAKTASGPQPVRMTLHMDPSLPESVQRRDAERELRNLEKRLSAEASTSYTVRDWSEYWVTKLLGPDCSPVTVSNYRYLLSSRINPTLGNYLLEDLTPAILTDWMLQVRTDKRKTTRKPDEDLSRPRRKREEAALKTAKQLQKPLSAKTALNYYACMSTMLEAAVRLGHLEHNPMDRVQRPRQKKNTRSKSRLSEESAIQLIELLQEVPFEQRHFRLAVLLALLCSLRLGEVGAIMYRDIDWERSTIRVDRALKYTSETGSFVAAPKTDSALREITLPQSMMDILRQARDDDQEVQVNLGIEDEEAGRPYRYHDNGYIIHSLYGKPLNKDTPSKWFRRFADAHGYKGITFHDLRHAHASILVAHNVDIAAIASRMGHSDATVTLSTYTHPFAAQDQHAAEILDTLLTRSTHPAADPDIS